MNQNLIEGLSAMCIGMGTVLMFLCMLIVAMIVMSAVVTYLNKICPEAVTTPSGAKQKKSSSNDEEIAVAILSAIMKK